MDTALQILIPDINPTGDQRMLLSRLYPWNQPLVEQEVRDMISRLCGLARPVVITRCE